MKKSYLFGLLATSALIVSGFPGVAFGHTDENPSAPVSLSGALADVESVTDVDGKALEIVDIEENSTEKTAAALTADGDPVIIRSLFGSRQSKSSLAVERVTEDQIIDASYTTDGEPREDQVKTFLSDLPQIAPDSLRLSQTTATSQTSFSIALADALYGEYDIYRGDDLIGTTVDGVFTDDGLAPGQNYTYTISSAGMGNVGEQFTYAVTTLALDAAHTLKNSSDPVNALAVKPTAQWFLYDTFITNQYAAIDLFMVLGGQCEGNVGDKYSGDSRSYKTPSLYEHPWDNRAIRTGAMAKADFTSSGAYVTKDRRVGATKLYSNTNVLKESRTASVAGIKFLEEAASSSLYQFRVSNLVRNPFCNQGAIRYEAYVNIWASGVMQLNGYRHPVPHHESYGMFTFSNGSQSWVQLYRGSNESFTCLGGACARQTLSKTFKPT